MFHLQAKHYAVIGGFLVALATSLTGLQSWGELLTKPSVGLAVLGQLGTFFTALGMTKPRQKYGSRPGDVGYQKIAAVGLVVALGALALAGAACTPKQYHIATVSATSAHESLKFTEDVLDSTVCGKPTAPVPPLKCTPVEKRRELATPLAQGYAIDGAVNKSIYDWNPSTGAKPDYASQLVEITKVIQTIVNALPNAGDKAKVAAVVNDKGGK